MDQIARTIAGVIAAEGGYVNNPNDKGGETNYGITANVARANGYQGPMRDMPKAFAEEIYRKRYVTEPKFDLVLSANADIGAELIDTGVNMGPARAAEFLQRALNALNDGRYQKLFVDGRIGPSTMVALRAFLAWRGLDGKAVMLTLLNSLQAVRYLEIAEHTPSQKTFLFGWIRTRVKL